MGGLRCRAAGRMGGVCRAFLLAARTDGPDASFTDGFWVGVV
jgi:hypothetical protein